MKHGRRPKRRTSKQALSENFRRFWELRGGAFAYEQWRLTGKMPSITIQVRGPNFTAGAVITDHVTMCAPILRAHILGKTESEARAIIKRKGWTAIVVQDKQEHGREIE